jgi:hypothetical protein
MLRLNRIPTQASWDADRPASATSPARRRSGPHAAAGNKVSVGCPRECGAVLDADELEAHYLSCPKVEDNEVVTCLHLSLGCQFQGRRDQVRKHLKRECFFEPVKSVLRGHVEELRELRSRYAKNQVELVRLRNQVHALHTDLSDGEGNGGVRNQRITFAPEQRRGGRAGEPRTGTEGQAQGAGVMEEQRKQAQAWKPSKCSVVLNEDGQAHAEGIVCLGYSPLYNLLFSGSLDRSIQAWDLSSHLPTAKQRLSGHTAPVTSLAATQHKLVSGAADHTATVWDLARMKAEQKLRGHAGPIHGVIVVHDLALTTSQDKTIKVWDLRLQTCAMTFSRLLIGFAVCGLGGEV